MSGFEVIDAVRAPAAPVRYGAETRWLHWSCAVLILAQFVLGELMHRVPHAWHGPIVSVHLSLGVLLAALFVARVAWRLTGGRAIRFAAGSARGARLAPLVHGGLYVLLGGVIALGYLACWSAGRPVVAFGVPIASPFAPPFALMSPVAHQRLGSLHGWLAWAIIIAALGHAAAALYHALVLRDGVLRRMWR
ncbi:cytochrome b/b6 domain-containing protein [Nguyenibacter sp. L1]|uniref:cytochrome b n=1 Tax=Nguyenibacter sp. L1 TaxID=3049350 RepID=UPI002B494F50|nr:cytochrome b/b6 domain-containing protein [Nguyenibacter sp. L1]WRH89513.1 cytochrome b/b6 domain-containing protein [Nguyenibacter sp. L1]